jgi:hypothetical protein
MANNIAYAALYMQMLDSIMKKGLSTALLESGDSKYRFSAQDAKTIYLRKMALDGLGDYSRSAGYVDGDCDISWEAHTFAMDRARKFILDTMDAKEAYTQAAEVASEFYRTHVIPEIDAYRFEKLCTLCGLDVSANLTFDTAVDALDTAIQTLDDAETAQEGRVVFVSNEFYKLLKQSGEFYNVRISNGENSALNRNIELLDGMPLVRVPSARFYNNFDFAANAGGGFAPAAGSKAINFIVGNVNESVAVIKHMAPKLIDPQFNATADGWIMAMRIYHDLFVADNKVGSFYIHTKA